MSFSLSIESVLKLRLFESSASDKRQEMNQGKAGVTVAVCDCYLLTLDLRYGATPPQR
jgi:hypothetical protein